MAARARKALPCGPVSAVPHRAEAADGRGGPARVRRIAGGPAPFYIILEARP
jgi:hypothetical protein